MIRLHHFPQTRSMRSLWLLHEIGVSFELVIQHFDKSGIASLVGNGWAALFIIISDKKHIQRFDESLIFIGNGVMDD